MPAMPSHIQRLAKENGVEIPKGAASNKQLMAFAAATYKDNKNMRRALRQSVAFYDKARSAYGKSNKRKPN